MGKLFIIGNGFDLGHVLPTNYSDFRNYLQEISNGKQVLPCDDDKTVSYSKQAEIAVKIMDEACLKHNKIKPDDWSELESALYYVAECIKEEVGNGNTHLFNYNRVFATTKNTFLRYWIDEMNDKITSANPIKNFQNLITDDDLFLSFNYTKTLEIVYGIDENQILHIHGVAGNPPDGFIRLLTNQLEHLVLGYGGDNVNNYTVAVLTINGDGSLFSTHDNLSKKVQDIISVKSKFFKNLANVTEVYSYGFSYGDADVDYIGEILSQIFTPQIKWRFHNYSAKSNSRYKTIVSKLTEKCSLALSRCHKCKEKGFDSNCNPNLCKHKLSKDSVIFDTFNV